MGKRPALIFDFGNVLVHFDYTRVGHALGPRVGLSGEAFVAEARRRGLPKLLQEYEAGKVDSEQFAESVCLLMGLDLPYEEFTAAWNDIFWVNEPVADLVASLKRGGYTLVLGSNTNDLHAAFYRRKFADALAPFDRLVLSFEVGHIKPSAPFYLACAEAAGADPSGCVFIDDLPENIEGARAAGLRGIVFRDRESLVADLLREGVDVGSIPPDSRMPSRGQEEVS